MVKRSTIPSAPKGLSAEARKRWRDTLTAYPLDSVGLNILEEVLRQFDRLRTAQARIAKEGAVIEDRFGQLKEHPCCKIENDAYNRMVAGYKLLNLDVEPLNDGPGRPAHYR